MAYKMGLLLSSVFMMAVFMFAGDLIGISEVHSYIDSIALNVAFKIASDGLISEKTRDYVSSTGATLYIVTTLNPSFGDIVKFKVSKNYKPLIIEEGEIVISVTRSTVVGYYTGI